MVPAEGAGLGSVREQNITIKELLLIVVAAALCGQHWNGKIVRAKCDNAAVMAMVNVHSYRPGVRGHAPIALSGIYGSQILLPCLYY